jgi:hypothetical protein
MGACHPCETGEKVQQQVLPVTLQARRGGSVSHTDKHPPAECKRSRGDGLGINDAAALWLRWSAMSRKSATRNEWPVNRLLHPGVDLEY